MVVQDQIVAREVGDEYISFVDLETGHPVALASKDIGDKLEKFKKVIAEALARVDKIDGYTLSEITISVGVSTGIFIVSLEGGISLTYSKPENK